MPARKSFLEAPDALEPLETSRREDTSYSQRRINKTSTIRSHRIASSSSSTPGTSRTVTKITFTQVGSRPTFDRDAHLNHVLKAQPSMTFSNDAKSTGMLTLLGQHFPELLSDGAFKRELERGKSREPHGSLRFRKSSGLRQMAQDTRIDKGRSNGRRHQEYYASSWRSSSSSRSKDPGSSVISLKRTSPAGIDRVEASVRSTILRPNYEELETEYPKIRLETAKDEPSFGSQGTSPLASSEGAETDLTSPSGDYGMIEQNSKRLRPTVDVPYQSYVEDDADEEGG
ncbi:hypothetical protein CB0940_09323 [Cercospora beticola]|uniref:Uncharacterized protein n=1 Tax=Cercospora beticola TaxID=122368 RepID=A0A2G5HHW9_CERBT|nr:hypothetical protein CB0940_09323 [Cercospora beticola]PIA92157.1 hypothetical protein CB0940_09323 [Cercospora beticola]WPB06362.1 hypothetical protein RHO25_011019 [Cercospora beticola]